MKSSGGDYPSGETMMEIKGPLSHADRGPLFWEIYWTLFVSYVS
jgi:hypothetical protein